MLNTKFGMLIADNASAALILLLFSKTDNVFPALVVPNGILLLDHASLVMKILSIMLILINASAPLNSPTTMV